MVIPPYSRKNVGLHPVDGHIFPFGRRKFFGFWGLIFAVLQLLYKTIINFLSDKNG